MVKKLIMLLSFVALNVVTISDSEANDDKKTPTRKRTRENRENKTPETPKANRSIKFKKSTARHVKENLADRFLENAPQQYHPDDSSFTE